MIACRPPTSRSLRHATPPVVDINPDLRSRPRFAPTQNVTVDYLEAHDCNGNAVVVADSTWVNIDAGGFDE